MKRVIPALIAAILILTPGQSNLHQNKQLPCTDDRPPVVRIFHLPLRNRESGRPRAVVPTRLLVDFVQYHVN